MGQNAAVKCALTPETNRSAENTLPSVFAGTASVPAGVGPGCGVSEVAF